MRSEGDINAATSEDSEPATIDDDGVEIPPPSHNEIRVAIQRLKNNKAARPDGLPAEMFEAGGDELVRSIHQLIYTIWPEESMPSDWILIALCPVLKKGFALIVYLLCISRKSGLKKKILFTDLCVLKWP